MDFDKVAMEVDHQLKVTHKPNGTTRYLIWEPTLTEIEFLRENPKRRKIDANSSTGLRGLYNLGNTCFMNCILQALTHTPVLRDYFLSDQHQCESEQKRSQCVVCAMNTLYQEFYCGKISPYIPFQMLFLIWINARNLAGYEQQDAHEFFISSLDVLHRQSGGPPPASEDTTDHDSESACNCFIDRIFGGKLQSDVICQTCDGISTTIDPFRDISLDLATHHRAPPKPFHGKSMPYNFSVPSNLLECLEKFTRQENLGEEKIYCGRCYSRQESTKRLLLYQLPLVFCFHLKRFEHSHQSRKISQFISFPSELDLTPFVAEKTKSGKDYRYSLFAVVNHSGSIHNGHYTCFIRQQDEQWFKCDDEWITRANLEDVLHSEA
jgi:ubiquitin carboxyl-terminal hydrolase 22/27/51